MKPVIKEKTQEVKDYIKKMNEAGKKSVAEMAKAPYTTEQVLEQAKRLREERKNRNE